MKCRNVWPFLAWPCAMAVVLALFIVTAKAEDNAEVQVHPLTPGKAWSGLHRTLVLPENTKNIVSLVRDTHGRPMYFPAPVSIAIASGNTAYVANYLDILVLDLATGIGAVLSRPTGIDMWMPTAVAYDANNKRLYVANYKGRDVLVLERAASGEPVLVHRFVDPKMQGPEGVAVSEDGQTVAVADYDIGAVHIFSSSGALQSSTPVGSAHGVTISQDGNTVIATGLTPPAIYRIGLDGSVLQVHMHSGWHANEYMYPTAITTTEGGFLAVTDAHSGQISLLSSQLTEVASTGANGANFTQFYLPYGIAHLQQSQLLVADTRKDRLIQLDMVAGTLIHVWRFHGLSGDTWRSRLLRPQGLWGLVSPVGSFGELFIAEKLVQPDIVLEHYTLPPSLLVSTTSPVLSAGFQGINTGDMYRLTLPDPEQTLPSLWYRTRIEFVADSNRTLSRASLFPLFTLDWMYFPYVVNLTPEGSCTVIGSSAMPEVIVLIRGTAFPMRLDYGLWPLTSGLVSDDYYIPYDVVCAEGNARYKHYLQLLQANVPPPQAWHQTAFPWLTTTGFHRFVERTLQTEAGHIFWAAMQAPSPNLTALHSTYWRMIRQADVLHLGEILLESSLTAAVHATQR